MAQPGPRQVFQSAIVAISFAQAWDLGVSLNAIGDSYATTIAANSAAGSCLITDVDLGVSRNANVVLNGPIEEGEYGLTDPGSGGSPSRAQGSYQTGDVAKTLKQLFNDIPDYTLAATYRFELELSWVVSGGVTNQFDLGRSAGLLNPATGAGNIIEDPETGVVATSSSMAFLLHTRPEWFVEFA